MLGVRRFVRFLAASTLLVGCAPNASSAPPIPDGFDTITPIEVRAEPVGATESAIDLAVRPGDDALYVVEQAGRVVRMVDGEGDVVLDLGDRFLGHGDEQGLNGLEFSADGAVAWLHGTDRHGRTVVSEMRVGTDGVFDATSEREVLAVDEPVGLNHNSGDLLLLDDGTLLVTLGDGQALRPGDPYQVAQDPTTLRGSLLRIRPTPGADTAYEIPADNPFADGPLARAGDRLDGAPEVFAWGLRNPWKIFFDETSESLWVADVGARTWEEIDVVIGDGEHLPGWARNFGWSRFEGRFLLNRGVELVGGEPVMPLHVYEHEGNLCAISGGAVYRGEALPELSSGYVFADFCDGSVWVLDVVSGEAHLLLTDIPGISGVRTGPDGELYVLSWFGEIHRVVRA